jgi:hypothetical protein
MRFRRKCTNATSSRPCGNIRIFADSAFSIARYRDHVTSERYQLQGNLRYGFLGIPNLEIQVQVKIK